MDHRIRIGVIGTANIAYKRMIPAIIKSDLAVYIGVAIADSSEWDEPHSEDQYREIKEEKIRKAEGFCEKFGGKVWEGYEQLIKSDELDAVYIPLPPSLHAHWVQKALEHGKHVLCEKPFTVGVDQTLSILAMAEKKGLSVAENYGFLLHPQMKEIAEVYNEGKGELGKLRLLRAQFSFPNRGSNDFRYSARYGGGALLDCGGYVVKAASYFLGDDLFVVNSILRTEQGLEVDLYGNAMLANKRGDTAQVSFGMDNVYRCEIELLCSKGSIKSSRAFTAQDDQVVTLEKQVGNEKYIINVEAADQFKLMIDSFAKSIEDEDRAAVMRKEIRKQAELVEEIKNMSGRFNRKS